MSAWADQKERTPPARRYALGSAEDVCIGLMLAVNRLSDAVILALLDGDIPRARALAAELRGMASGAAIRLDEIAATASRLEERDEGQHGG